jgi:hypothetical protein
VVTEATALAGRESSTRITANMENAHFVRRHMEGDSSLNAEFLFEIEDGSDCPRDSIAVDTFGVSIIFIWNAPDALSSALVLRKLLDS